MDLESNLVNTQFGLSYTRPREKMEVGRRPLKRFFRVGGRFMAASTQEPRKKFKNRK